MRRIVQLAKHTLLAVSAGSTLSLGAATWYVDKDAAGSGSGTSWTNAWTSLQAIQWSLVQPGDNVYISGGPHQSSKVYGGPLNIARNGTANQRIVVGVDAVDPLHNGTVVVQSSHVELTKRQFITLNGNVQGEQHFLIRDFFDPQTATFANAIMAPESVGVKLDSISWSNVNNAVNFTGATGFWITNGLARQIRGDAVVRAGSAFGNGYDANVIENCDFEVVVSGLAGPTLGFGPDGVQTGNNITARNNTFRVRKANIPTSLQHVDMFQAPGVYLAIYNNEFINVGDSCIALGSWWPNAVHQHIRIFNNVFRIVEEIDPYPEYIRLYNNVGPIADISDLIIAHNLFLDNPKWVNIDFPHYGPGAGAHPTGSGNYIANNVWCNSGAGGCWRLKWSNRWQENTWTIDGNLYFPGGSSAVTYQGVVQKAPTWVRAREPHGSIAKPEFKRYLPFSVSNDLEPAPQDTAMRRRAIKLDLGAFDKKGRVRPLGKAWNVGPYESGLE